MSRIRTVALFAAGILLVLVAVATATDNPGRQTALPFDELAASTAVTSGVRDAGQTLGSPGDLVDFGQSIIKAGNYLKAMQADVTEDNAGNGSGVGESPNDPDDAGWDWRVTSPPAPFFHTTAASPLNIYGATAQGLYHAYLATSDASYFTAMQDAANVMAANAGIRSGSDLKFLMLFDDLPSVSGTTYQDAAKAKYDARITTYGSAGALARYIRDARAGQGYANGIIAWDIGIWAVVAQMLDDRYGSYAADADSIAEVLWQDSYNDNPGYFDVVDDAGWDSTGADPDFWMYTLGITGLLDAFRATGSHTAEIPDLLARLQASQYSNGAFSYSYGAHSGYGYATYDEDWQSTAYAVLALHEYDPVTYGEEIVHGAYWSAATQDVSGGWLYSSGNHYPEVCGENTVAVAFGFSPDVVWVDDDWTSQEDVDVYNAAHGTSLLWGYDAFATIQDGVDGVSGSTVNILPGTYVLTSTVNLNVPNLLVDGSGAGQTIVQVAQAVGYAFNISAAGVTLQDIELQKTDVTGLHNLIYIGASNVSILNNLIYGPDPGTPWSVNGIVSRAMITTGGLSGLLIDGNTIRHLRQPAYFSGPTTGVVSNNAVSGTRGWVNEGANLTFTGNSWPLPPNQGAEIALLAYAVDPSWYPDLIGLSNANNNAYIDAQFTGGDKGRAISYVDDSALPGGFGSILAPVQTISAGIAGVLATGTVNVAAGTYVDNLVVGKPMTMLGAGASTTLVYPALSAPNPGGSGSLPPGSSNMVLVQANDVTITGFTFDGDNPSLTSGVVRGGADLDARNGIITNHALGLYNNLVVDNCTVKNIYLRGIYASSGGTFNFHHNVVDNVQGETASIGLFNFYGSGIFDHNTVSNCNDAIASNWSSGCTFTYNVVTGSGSGIHTDNAGSAVGSTADLIENNNISNSPTNGYGIFVFAPYLAPVVNLNTITNVDVGLTCAGSYVTPTPPEVQFTNNIVNGMGKANSAGIYVTNEIWGYTSGNVAVHFENNSITNFTEGVYLVCEAGKTNSTTLLNNMIKQNGLGISNAVGTTYGGGTNVGAVITATQNVIANTVNATDNKSGNSYDNNCWSDYNGIPPYAVGGSGGNVDNNPSTDCGLAMSPENIFYNCSGTFSVNVDIGSAVTAMDAANIHFEYPAELGVTTVTAASSNYFLAYTQSSHAVGTKDTLKVNLGVLTGVQDGPATLFTFTMSGTVSVCNADQIKMVYADLRDSTNTQIVAPLAVPVTFKSDCNDPDIVVNSPASGGFFNLPPVLSLTATDDCDLDVVYYQIDGCASGGWIALASGLSGTTYNAMWTVPGFVGMPDGEHCIRFKVVDDNARANADSCSFTWCFTKDVAPPPPPTNLAAAPGHNKVHLTWTNASTDFDHTVVMRTDWYAGGHGYPEYDDDNAEGPYPVTPAAGDQVYNGTAAAHVDVTDLSNATRDVYHYAAFTVDKAGNFSVASNGARATSYWLGDVKSPFDGSVYFLDLVVFSSTYGLQHGDVGYNNEADFGPTFTGSPKSIPMTDSRVEFEDLVIFAINFDAVSPLVKDRPILVQHSTQTETGLRLVQRLTDDGIVVDLYLDNPTSAAKALLADIEFDPSLLEYATTIQSDNLATSPRPIFFKALTSPKRVSISAAALGAGSTFDGSGMIATVVFKPLGSDKPSVQLTRADVRDSENKRLIDHLSPTIAQDNGIVADIPESYVIEQNRPNPFNPETVIRYALPAGTQVSVRVYNVVGQLVRTLVDEYQTAGAHDVTWNGTNDNGERVASGIYFYRFETADYQKTIKMTLLK